MDEVSCHCRDILRVIVEGGDGGKNDGSCFRRELHIAKVNAVEGSFAHAKDERSSFLQADVRRAMNKVGCKAVGDGSQRSHRTGKHDHGVGGIAPAGDAGTDIGCGVLMEFRTRAAEEFFSEVISAAQRKFFGKDAERVFRGHKVNARDTIVAREGAEHLGGIDGAAGSGDRECDVVR